MIKLKTYVHKTVKFLNHYISLNSFSPNRKEENNSNKKNWANGAKLWKFFSTQREKNIFEKAGGKVKCIV